MHKITKFLAVPLLALASLAAQAQRPNMAPLNLPDSSEVDYELKDFKFQSGETIPALRLHYTTFGKPVKDKKGRVINAIYIMHGTTGNSHNFVNQGFGGHLFEPGQTLDATKYFIILPDGIGHGKSSKPSDGLHMKFPKYTYDDMVQADYKVLTEKMGINHLRLVMGTSMGAMHCWVWAETYPDFMDACMANASLPVEIAGRNRMTRYIAMESIKHDPNWKKGEYTSEPTEGLRGAEAMLLVMGSAPLLMQKNYPTRAQAEKYVDDYMARTLKATDANDLIYYVNASRNYNPEPKLSTIVAPALWINSADDFINPPELPIAERVLPKMPKTKFILIPISDATRGHGTHTQAAIWQKYLVEFMRETEK